MVQKFKPDVKLETWSHPCSDQWTYVSIMEQSQYGEWVKLQTYTDATAALNAQIVKLKKRIKVLEKEMDDSCNPL